MGLMGPQSRQLVELCSLWRLQRRYSTTHSILQKLPTLPELSLPSSIFKASRLTSSVAALILTLLLPTLTYKDAQYRIRPTQMIQDNPHILRCLPQSHQQSPNCLGWYHSQVLRIRMQIWRGGHYSSYHKEYTFPYLEFPEIFQTFFKIQLQQHWHHQAELLTSSSYPCRQHPVLRRSPCKFYCHSDPLLQE